MKIGKLKTSNGTIEFVPGMEDSGCVVFGAAKTGVLPYEVKVALGAGKRRSALALVHELLHCVDYTRGDTLDHTLLHNIAAVIESEVLQRMGGYYAE
jgi:hypothetical protein